nr:porin [Shewanella sp. c952]
MIKSILAIAISTCCLSANAAEIYKNENSSINLTGWLGFAAINDGDKTSVNDNLSRFRFSFEREEKNGWHSFARTEWGLNIVTRNDNLVMQGGKLGTENSSDFLYNRLGYIGLTHDTWGTLSFGKQWGVYWDVASTTDLPNVYAGYSSGVYTFGDGGLTGTGRADSAFQYRNTFGKLHIGLQFAAKNNGEVSIKDASGLEIDNSDISFNNSYGASLTYGMTDKVKLLAGFNRGEFDGHLGDIKINEANEVIGVGAQYGDYYQYAANREAQGLYFGFNAHQSKKNELIGGELYDATGVELLTAYQYDNGFVPMVLLSYLELDTDQTTTISGDWKRQFAMLGLHYRYSNDTVMFAEAKLDLSSMDDPVLEAMQDNSFAVGLNYFF